MKKTVNEIRNQVMETISEARIKALAGKCLIDIYYDYENEEAYEFENTGCSRPAKDDYKVVSLDYSYFDAYELDQRDDNEIIHELIDNLKENGEYDEWIEMQTFGDEELEKTLREAIEVCSFTEEDLGIDSFKEYEAWTQYEAEIDEAYSDSDDEYYVDELLVQLVA